MRLDLLLCDDLMEIFINLYFVLKTAGFIGFSLNLHDTWPVFLSVSIAIGFIQIVQYNEANARILVHQRLLVLKLLGITLPDLRKLMRRPPQRNDIN